MPKHSCRSIDRAHLPRCGLAVTNRPSRLRNLARYSKHFCARQRQLLNKPNNLACCGILLWSGQRRASRMLHADDTMSWRISSFKSCVQDDVRYPGSTLGASSSGNLRYRGRFPRNMHHYFEIDSWDRIRNGETNTLCLDIPSGIKSGAKRA